MLSMTIASLAQDRFKAMTSGRLPGDFWPRCAGWAAPGAASEESEIEDLEGSDQNSPAADLENETDLITPMKRPSSNQKPKPKAKPKVRSKPMMKRPASAVAMADAAGSSSSPSRPSKSSKPFKKPSASVKVTKQTKTAETKEKKEKKTTKEPDSQDKSKGCSKCRWTSGCRSCNWRGIKKKHGDDADDDKSQHGDGDGDDGDQQEEIEDGDDGDQKEEIEDVE